MKIIKASLSDYNVIHAIALTTWHATYNDILSPDQMEYMLEMMYSNEAIADQIAIKGHHFLLAEEEGEYLGFASYELNSLSETTKLHKLYVLPQAHGKGVGKALVTVIQNAAKSNNNNKIILNVNKHNPAINFYLKSGFINKGEDIIDIGNGYIMDDYLMMKEL
ncbi:GNAT family N-acetyltransferase [Flavobacterium sp. Sd200]|uniref:GNAT family N-acetyltransferase n=1 Tax=Flavobacterium sp. Sd200 TaxID=2692211 RepID=UPI00136E4AB9|nr:GNAT family N-acetyltransferase [Flavobacterium sp. Sd200]MXN90525.1 GNAT family N-acetyltransferase [Flavobacterium sp. Sd200]